MTEGAYQCACDVYAGGHEHVLLWRVLQAFMRLRSYSTPSSKQRALTFSLANFNKLPARHLLTQFINFRPRRQLIHSNAPQKNGRVQKKYAQDAAAEQSQQRRPVSVSALVAEAILFCLAMKYMSLPCDPSLSAPICWTEASSLLLKLTLWSSEANACDCLKAVPLHSVHSGNSYCQPLDVREPGFPLPERSHRLCSHLVCPWQIDDLKDRLVSGSEGSRAMREIRTRDPSFDMNNFVRAVKVSIIGGLFVFVL